MPNPEPHPELHLDPHLEVTLELNLEATPEITPKAHFEAYPQSSHATRTLGFSQPQSEAEAGDHASSAAFYEEAHDAKAFARERLLFRLSKAAGAEISESVARPVAPVSAAARAELGNPLGAFLLEARLHKALAESGASKRSRS